MLFRSWSNVYNAGPAFKYHFFCSWHDNSSAYIYMYIWFAISQYVIYILY